MALRRLPLAAVIFLAASTAALADAIDGDWCSADGSHMTIEGENVTTPGGTRIKGNYTRHAFDYVVPNGENGSGETVNILLQGEYLALSRQGSASAPQADASIKQWRRCANRTS